MNAVVHETPISQSGQRFELQVLGVPVAFRATADPARIETAKRLIEERYEDLKNHGRHADREQLLMIFMIGIADGMLHVQQETDRRVRDLLLQIEESEKK
jgi:cell division protein ZapA